MRILHVIPTLDPLHGGPPLITAGLAAAQRQLGHDVGVMTYRSRSEGLGRIAAETTTLPGFDRVRVHSLPYIGKPEQWFGGNAAREAAVVVPDYDVVHLHGVWEPILWRTAAVARSCRTPYVVLLHGMLLPWAMKRGVWKKRLAMLAGAKAMLNGGTLQFGSTDEEAAARAFGFSGPGVVIPNGITRERFADRPPAGSSTVGTGSSRRGQPVDAHGRGNPATTKQFVLFLGRLHEQKGVDLLVPAMKYVDPSIELVIAGPDFGRRAELVEQIEAAGLSGRVRLIGPLFGRDKQAALVDAACFVLPSRHEGFSLAVLDALALGTPVVISTECHFPDVETAGAGRVTDLDPANIGKAINDVVTRRAEMSTAAVRLVHENYTWDAIAGRAVELYRSLPASR